MEINKLEIKKKIKINIFKQRRKNKSLRNAIRFQNFLTLDLNNEISINNYNNHIKLLKYELLEYYNFLCELDYLSKKIKG